jgi:hypothetical protein
MKKGQYIVISHNDEVISNSRLRLSTVKNLLAGDILDINGQKRTIRRISGDQVVLTQVLSPVPDVDDVITKSPVYDVYYGNKKLVLDRDYTITNTTEAIIEIDPLAEFNIAPIKSVAISLTFTNSSRSVTTSADVDLKTLFKSRDWIRSNDITHQVWYEILTVAEKSITLRLVYAGSTATNQAKKKEPNYIEDGSLITVSCVGIERDGEWIKTTYISPNGTKYTVTTTYLGGLPNKPSKKGNDTLSSLKNELEKCVENQDFEKAAQLRDQIKRTEINKAHIDKLEVELKMAIDKQDFEEAIKLRDKIKELKS